MPAGVIKSSFTVRLTEEISQVKTKAKLNVRRPDESAQNVRAPIPRKSMLRPLPRGAPRHLRSFMWLGEGSPLAATLNFGGPGVGALARHGPADAQCTSILLAIFPRSTVVCEGLPRPLRRPWPPEKESLKEPSSFLRGPRKGPLPCEPLAFLRACDSARACSLERERERVRASRAHGALRSSPNQDGLVAHQP